MHLRAVSFVLCTFALLVGSGTPALAATAVPEGTGTLQAAIDAAAPGASLVLEGIYVGPVVIDKPLHITCIDYCGIDANCEAPVALDIAADGVLIRAAGGSGGSGTIDVYRGTHTQIRIANRKKVVLRNRINALKLFLNSCGTEQNGIEVSGTSSKVQLKDARAFMNPGVGLLLSGLVPRSAVNVSLFYSVDNGIGISVENSAVGAKLGGSGIIVNRSILVDNDVGVRVVGSDGLRIARTEFIVNADMVGAVGVSLDASSNRMLLMRSRWADHSGIGTSYVDAGTGTCGIANQGFDIPTCQ